MNRLKELDFLRGIAILLVLCRHQELFDFTVKMGWIGVDLFFVLSGFLVSGLLFKEYIKFGDIHPKRFLIRRAFKVYPVYFIIYPIYLFFIYPIDFYKVIPELTFTQNYLLEWGYAFIPGWSLAIEEHFYLLVALALWVCIKYKYIKLREGRSFEMIIYAMMAICLIMRFWHNQMFWYMPVKNFTMTHLRIDSLLAGMLIAYFYYFKREYLKMVFFNNKYVYYIICFLGLVWTPFVEPVNSFFVKTIGFTLLFISFGIILIKFLLDRHINKKLNLYFSLPLVNLISKIGYCSYSIYIVHVLAIYLIKIVAPFLYYGSNIYVKFVMTTSLSIILGILITSTLERRFLKLRDRLYPSRSSLELRGKVIEGN